MSFKKKVNRPSEIRPTTWAKVVFLLGVLFLFGMVALIQAQFVATDPGVRVGAPGAGGPVPGLTPSEREFFNDAVEAFKEVESVSGDIADAPGTGLGPRFNADSCAACHAHPATGGSSPLVNPQIEIATKAGATNTIPSFIQIDGPVREARFKYKADGTRDGGVHGLFTIMGRTDAVGCVLLQPDFETAVKNGNVVFRIPSPLFGAGLIEAIPDANILASWASTLMERLELGISGRANRSDNDGTISRFGWKAQNKSLEIFAGEAYNVEQGVTNELFPNERDATEACVFNATPEDHIKFDEKKFTEALSDLTKFAIFMRMLAPPAPVADTPSIVSGRTLFNQVGCALCHTPTLYTRKSSIAALSFKPARLYSDLLTHHMGSGLADNIIQGQAGDDEFRTAPLWGLGQRIFFLHDGRTADLLEAIQAHASPANGNLPASEANAVIDRFNALSELQKQDVLNFLRGL